VIAHVVLFRPRPDLSADDRRAFIDALDRAVRGAPTLRRAHVGARIRIGAQYEQLPQPSFPYAAILEFDDRAGLDAYLSHEVHQELGARFYASAEAVLVYDFEMTEDVRGVAMTGDGSRG
jgi:hypothetical protein